VRHASCAGGIKARARLGVRGRASIAMLRAWLYIYAWACLDRNVARMVAVDRADPLQARQLGVHEEYVDIPGALQIALCGPRPPAGSSARPITNHRHRAAARDEGREGGGRAAGVHVEFGRVGPTLQNGKSAADGCAAAAQRSMDGVAAPGFSVLPARLIGDAGLSCGDSGAAVEEERTKRHAPGIVLRLGGLPSLSCCSCCRRVGSSKLRQQSRALVVPLTRGNSNDGGRKRAIDR
jgi:hypothetical protein